MLDRNCLRTRLPEWPIPVNKGEQCCKWITLGYWDIMFYDKQKKRQSKWMWKHIWSAFPKWKEYSSWWRAMEALRESFWFNRAMEKPEVMKYLAVSRFEKLNSAKRRAGRSHGYSLEDPFGNGHMQSNFEKLLSFLQCPFLGQESYSSLL